MKKRKFLHSLNDAAEGFIYVVRYERNMRLHFLFAFLVLLLAIFLGVSRLEWIILCLVTSLVLVAEMMNTAIEEITDEVKNSFHPAARVIKHIAAGAVLLAAANALIAGFFIFSHYGFAPFDAMTRRVRYAPWHITFVSLLTAIFLVVAGKAFWRRGRPFRGGAVSGHAAAAFSLWTAVLFMQSNAAVNLLTFIMAFLVAQSRLRANIHSAVEVAAGAVIGTLVTTLFFQIFG